MFRWAPLRLVGDLLLIVTGAFWGLIFVGKDLAEGVRGEALRNHFFLNWSQARWFIAVRAVISLGLSC